MSTSFYSKLHKIVRLYDACGNIIGIVPLGQIGYNGNFRKDSTLRSILCEWGKGNECDSIMILLGRPELKDVQGFHVRMYVFEPKGTDNSGLAGGISTMCGNGIRAVAHFIEQIIPNTKHLRIMTESGIREVFIKSNGSYQVNMGRFFSDSQALSQYINTDKIRAKNTYFIDSPIPKDLKYSINKYISASNWSIGLNGNVNSNGYIDGEPHVVIFLNQGIEDIFDLQKIARQVGPLITKNLHFFPHEINVNFAVINWKINSGNSQPSVLLCTHERNLGSNPNDSVTAACGTGSTVVGALIYQKFDLTDQHVVNVHVPGGKLIISKSKGNLLMTGSVRCLL